MKKGEVAELKCSKDYADADGAKVTLSLKEIFETKDVSFAKDKSVMKKQVKEGEGYDMPKDASAVKLSVRLPRTVPRPCPASPQRCWSLQQATGRSATPWNVPWW